MNYDELPNRGKEASDGERVKNCWCTGRCYVFYDENESYHVECENCGTVVSYKAKSEDWAIKMWNDMPSPVGYCEQTKRNYLFRDQKEIRIVRNFLRHMTKAYRARTQNYRVVGDILLAGTSTAGMTSCIVKCRELGIDPFGYEL